MKWWILLALLGCGSDPAPSATPPPPASSDAVYRADIENICDVLVRSKAVDLEPNDRTFVVATWLSQNLTSPASRTFLANIQPLAGEPKAAALEAEAKRVGLAACPLAAEWRTPRLPGIR